MRVWTCPHAIHHIMIDRHATTVTAGNRQKACRRVAGAAGAGAGRVYEAALSTSTSSVIQKDLQATHCSSTWLLYDYMVVYGVLKTGWYRMS